ncbi:MAG: DMT family transporter [Rhodobacteraceae bacterium]|nr:DMT family transporter [Paracoccaceae bacterium]
MHHKSSENFNGIVLMVLSMLGFALADTGIKILDGAIPVGELLMLLGAGGGIVFGLMAKANNHLLFGPALKNRSVQMRAVGEIIGTIGFVTALSLTTISAVSAILQMTPLIITLGAALFLKEHVGIYRWSAILVGLIGMLLILRPGSDSFDPNLIFAVVSVIGLAMRDLATRTAPRAIPAMVLAFYGFAILVPTGAIMMVVTGQAVWPNLTQVGIIFGIMTFDAMGYFAITMAMRMGDVSVITPFRYSRLLFAVILGVLVFDEVIDIWMAVGTFIILGSGLFTIYRERRVAKH